VVRAEDAERADFYAELLGELCDLAGTLLQDLPRLGIGGRAELGRMFGDEGECCHDFCCSFWWGWGRVAAACFANLSSSFPVAGRRCRTAYDEAMKQIPCVCGRLVMGEDDDELWRNAQAHLQQDHPELVGKVSRADLLAQAEEVPKQTS
jgi:hypothetical protein